MIPWKLLFIARLPLIISLMHLRAIADCPCYHLVVTPTVSQWCLIPEVVWYVERTPPDMWYLCHMTIPSSAENKELVGSLRTQNYITIPGGAPFREDTAIPVGKINNLHFVVIFSIFFPSIFVSWTSLMVFVVDRQWFVISFPFIKEYLYL